VAPMICTGVVSSMTKHRACVPLRTFPPAWKEAMLSLKSIRLRSPSRSTNCTAGRHKPVARVFCSGKYVEGVIRVRATQNFASFLDIPWVHYQKWVYPSICALS